MTWLEIEGRIFDMTILLKGFMSQRICFNWLLIVIVWVDSKSANYEYFLTRKENKKTIIWNAKDENNIFWRYYFSDDENESLWGITSIEFKKSAYKWLGELSIAAAEAL